MPDIESRIAELTPDQRALLTLLLQRKKEGKPPSAAITRRKDPSAYPLSFAQQRLWFLSQLDPNNPAYNISAALRLQGPLHVAAFEQSLQEVLRRHEVLRMVYRSVDGMPKQVVGRGIGSPLPVQDLSHLPEELRLDAVRQRAAEESKRPFDLADGPLVRGTLLHLSDEDHVVLMTFHHIVFDGWSTGVFLHEMSALYNAYVERRVPALPKLPIQYFDFAEWQHQYLEGEMLQRQLAYWTKHLDGATAPLELSADRPRPPAQTFAGAHRTFVVPSPVHCALLAIARDSGATMFMTLLAGFELLLSRLSGQTHLNVGIPIANRTHREVEGLIGFFVNTLVVRSDLGGTPSFRDVLRRTRETVLAAYANQELPFERLVEALLPDRSLSSSPLFQVSFDLQRDPLSGFVLDELHASLVDIETGTAKFDLNLIMTEGEQGLSGVLEYNTDLFDGETAVRITRRFEKLLTELVAHPDRPVSHLDLLPEEERHTLLHEWAGQRDHQEHELTVCDLFETQVANTPDAISLTCKDVLLTYCELNERANQLARYLRDLGIGPESVVGICFERSLSAIIAILAVLKAGGAYLPMDTGYPKNRLSYMLEDSGVEIVLTDSSMGERVAGTSARVIALDSVSAQLKNLSGDNLGLKVTPQSLAYVIYTSGSTGAPKGVLLQHDGLLNLVQWHIRQYGVTSNDRATQLAGLGFDAAVWEIFPYLAAGASIHIVDDPLRTDPTALMSWLVGKEITIAFLPTPLAESVIGLPWPSETALRALLTGGDVLHRWSPKDLRFGFFNHYGPTESTVVTTSCPVHHAANELTLPPIGRPIANVTAYLLDEHLELAPLGVPGELYVGGSDLARGYLRRPELTAERFIPDRFADEPGSRLYRTGDRCRYLNDGNIEFLGRFDTQVKIRGFRIELGEIERLLEQHPGVQDAVVIAREDVPGDKRLVAYYVPAANAAPDTQTLRQCLGRQLPEYMVPTTYVVLPAIPVTPNGKVDRARLPKPAAEDSQTDRLAVPPRTGEERIIADIWNQLLGSKHIGVHENFFALGGHSLLATQVMSKVEGAFGVTLPVRTLFENPTIASLASRVEEAQGSSRATHIPPLENNPDDGPLPLSFAQQRLWFLDQLEPGNPQYNIAGGLRLKGKLDYDAFKLSLEDLANRHAVLRTSFPSVEGRAIQEVSAHGDVPLTIVDGKMWPETERETRALECARLASRQSFTLAEGPLLRVHLIRIDQDDHLAVFVMHHIISDGWSMRILLHELSSIYRSHILGSELSLPALAVQYSDFARWQRMWMSGDLLQGEIEYWKKKLSGAPRQLDLPLDRPRPAMQSSSGAHCHFKVPEELSNALRELSRKEGTTLFMTLLAAFQVMLAKCAGEEDVSVGIPIANRGNPKTENLVGLFVNTVVIRTVFSSNPTVHEVLRLVRESVLDAHAHQDVPFEEIVDALEPERDLSRTPLFQVMFVEQNAGDIGLDIPDAIVVPVTIDAGVSPFDVTLVMETGSAALSGVLEYNTDLFDERTVCRFGAHYLRILERFAANVEERVEDIRMLTPEERRVVVFDWNETKADFPLDVTVHALVEEQVRRTPEGLALADGARRLTYDQLNRWANFFAHQMKRAGAGPDVPIGLCLERSVEAAIGMLAILKSGGAYVPIDPTMPAERIAALLEDCGTALILTRENLVPKFRGRGIATVALDISSALVPEENCENPVPASVPENLAYVIYTSGTTGRPKGVLVSHRSMANHNQAAARMFQLEPSDTVLQFASLSFDAAVEEFFPAWITGATVVLRNDDVLSGFTAFHEFIERERITVVDLPTAFWGEWARSVAESQAPLPECLRLVIVGGDAVSPDRFRKWRSIASAPVRWLNTYGPTETTVIATSYDPGLDDFRDNVSSVPIGRPIANTSVYVLDRRMSPVPVGVAGEIFIGGESVSRGYHRMPDRTAERFMPDALSGRIGGRLYRTGDRGFLREDGQICFLGRMDDQVKIRGFRVEPAEIASALLQHPQVRDAAVVSVNGENGKRLVAYWVAKPGAVVDTSDLRRFLGSRLPDFMIPFAFQSLTAIPRSHTGKVDRRALPKITQTDVTPTSGRTEPATAEESLLVDIWKRVLGRESISLNDNFFELGGDSILSIQVIAKARAAGLMLAPRDVFQNPTVEGLAAVAGKVQLPSCEQGTVTGEALLTPIQRWFFEQRITCWDHWNQSLLIRSEGPLQPPLLRRAVRELVCHHDILRARFVRSSNGWSQQILAQEAIDPFMEVDLHSVLTGEESLAIEHVAADIQRTLDLEQGPVLRVAYLDLGAERSSRLLFVIHHLVVDSVSWRILLEDFMTAYQSLVQREPVRFLPKTTSYRAWAERLRQFASSDVLKDEMHYWTSLSILRWKAGAIPVDFKGGRNTFGSTDGVIDVLTGEETSSLVNALSPSMHAGVDEILLTVFAQTITRWTRRTALLIDMEFHGRNALWDDIDLSRTVGWFTGLFPLGLELSRDQDWIHNLRTVCNQVRGVPNKGLGFGVLRYLSPDQNSVKRLRQMPPPELSFNFLGQFDHLLAGQTGLSLAEESPGSEHDPSALRANLIDVMGRIVNGQLEVLWEYSKNVHRRETIAALATDFGTELRRILAGPISGSANDETGDAFMVVQDEKGIGSHG